MGETWDFFVYSSDVCKFLKDMKAKSKNLIKGNYDKFLAGVDKLCKKHQATIDKPMGFLGSGDGRTIDELVKLCQAYTKKGKDAERKGKIEALITKLTDARGKAVANLTDAKLTGGRTFAKDLDDPAYSTITMSGGLAEQFQSDEKKYKFSNNKHLQTIDIAKDVNKIPNEGFVNCTKLTTINIEPRTNTLEFEAGAIQGCNSFKEITGDRHHVEFTWEEINDNENKMRRINKSIQNCNQWNE